MTSLCRRLSPTCELNNTGNCKLGHDCRMVRSPRRHNATRLRCWQICSDSWRLSPAIVANCVHTADWVASASAVCIGLKYSALQSSWYWLTINLQELHGIDSLTVSTRCPEKKILQYCIHNFIKYWSIFTTLWLTYRTLRQICNTVIICNDVR